jgi:hypothetical protein
MTKTIRSLIAAAAFALGVAFGGTDVAAAACNNSAASLVNPVCGSSGYNIYAAVGQTTCSFPSSVAAEVYDNAVPPNLIETFALTYNAGPNNWDGFGACINPHTGYQVRFVATGGQIDDATGSAVTVFCGAC